MYYCINCMKRRVSWIRSGTASTTCKSMVKWIKRFTGIYNLEDHDLRRLSMLYPILTVYRRYDRGRRARPGAHQSRSGVGHSQKSLPTGSFVLVRTVSIVTKGTRKYAEYPNTIPPIYYRKIRIVISGCILKNKGCALAPGRSSAEDKLT